MGGQEAGQLLEREGALEQLEDVVARALAGDGTAVLVTGHAGAGKTSLLQAAGGLASAAGARVLTASCAAAERSYSFGVVGQVVRPLLSHRLLSASARAGLHPRPDELRAGPVDGFAVLDELYWALVDLADGSPLVVLVDDLQWCDEPSLRWLSFVVRRLAGVAASVVIAARPVEDRVPALAAVVSAVDRTIELAPLTAPAAGDLLCQRSGVQLPRALLERCHAVTGGNPFYLDVLARAVRECGHGALEAALGADDARLPETVRRGTLRRLAELGPPVQTVARAVAVLGPSATPEAVAVLAGMSVPRAVRAAEAAASAHVLAVGPTVSFVHPLVEAAVADALPPDEQDRLHRAAARYLATAVDDPERAASQLVRTRLSDDLWVVEVLRAGARTARARGAPETAAEYLRRAVLEPVARRRPELLLELGAAELAAGDPRCTATLSGALALASDDDAVVVAARPLAQGLSFAGDVAGAVLVLEQARARVRPGSLHAARLDLDITAIGSLDRSTLGRARQALVRLGDTTGDERLDRLLNASRSVELARTGDEADRAAELARQAVAGGRLFDDEGIDVPAVYRPLITLMLTDALDDADRHLSEMVRRARALGNVSGLAQATMWRSHVALRRGDVVAAGEDAELAVGTVTSTGLIVFLPYATSFLCDVLVERGELEEAEGHWADVGLHSELPPVLSANYALFSRGCLHLVQGRPDAAARDLLESGRRQREWRAGGPGFWPWAPRAAVALHLLGDEDRALALLEEDLTAARRFGALRPIGLALHARAALERGADRVARLESAVEVLAGAPARLDHARACVDLGTSLLRVHRTDRGVEVLRDGLQRAVACGATALVQRATAELVAAGVRPRPLRGQGVEVLTISERRVAALAAQGQTNRVIAQGLFVTPKTVETHLSHVFRKLGVSARGQLRDVPGLLGGL